MDGMDGNAGQQTEGYWMNPGLSCPAFGPPLDYPNVFPTSAQLGFSTEDNPAIDDTFPTFTADSDPQTAAHGTTQLSARGIPASIPNHQAVAEEGGTRQKPMRGPGTGPTDVSFF